MARAGEGSAMRHPFASGLVLLLLLAAAPVGWTLEASPAEILTNPDRLDGKLVTLTGVVTNLQPRMSRRGNPYYTFDLTAEGRAVRVFSFGRSPCQAGATATVEGTFQRVKRVGRYTFYNEVEAREVTCR